MKNGFYCMLRHRQQRKVILTEHLYPVGKHFCLDGSGCLQDDSAPNHKHKDLFNGLKKMK